MGDDRRKHKRAPLLLDMVWEGGAGKYEARTGDIGVGGCFIDSIGQVTVGENINFKLCLPGGRWIEFQGEVTYEFPNMGFGVRFTNMSEEAAILIAQLVDSSAT